jgi:metallo-beta-lactamase family protein
MEDAKNVMKLFKGIYYNHLIDITNGVKVNFRDAGHILGSAMIEVFATEDAHTKKIVFSGDIGQIDSPIVRDPSIIRDADYVLIESTYGSRDHEDIKERKEMLYELIRETESKNGYLIIPTFALERTQEILYVLNEFSDNDLLRKINVYVDSPLAEKATTIFLKHTECYDDEMMRLLAQDSNPFVFDELKFMTSRQDSMELNNMEGPIVIMSGSGMCTGGRIKHHLKHHLSDKRTTILFVGYQASGTLGRRIREGESPVKIYGEDIEVNANVVAIGGFSSHADQSGLVSWAKNFLPKKPIFFVVHGEPDESEALKKKLNVLGFKTIVPSLFDSYKI